jgi:uncharacterized protein YbbK (DUF523 family)
MKVLVSRCLLGEPVRWHGKKLSMSSWLRKWLAEHPGAEIVPVCPELLGGLGVPRPPVKRRKGHVFITCADKSKRKQVTGPEVTEEFRAGAVETLRIAEQEGCSTAILCKWSPSCDATGVTGKLLISHGIAVINTF